MGTPTSEHQCDRCGLMIRASVALGREEARRYHIAAGCAGTMVPAIATADWRER